MIGIGIGISFYKNKITQLLSKYKSRVISDSGSIRSDVITRALFAHFRDNATYDQIKALFCAESGIKTRTSGIYSYITKAYSLDSFNTNFLQTTDLLQPVIAGNIATDDLYSAFNPSGSGRYLSHSVITEFISFASNKPWTLSVLVNWPGAIESVNSIVGYGVNLENSIGFRRDSYNRFNFFNASGTGYNTTSTQSTTQLVGKNSLVTYVAAGDGTLKIYVNAVLFEQISAITSFACSSLFKIMIGNKFFGRIYYYKLQSGAQALTSLQSEYNFLRIYYPEINTALVSSKIVSVNNLDIICTSNGTVIADGTDTAKWIDGTAYWCLHTSNAGLVGKLYNRAACAAIAANPPAGYHVATEAELTAIAENEGNALKVAGTNYWSTTGGTNSTGFSAIGSGYRNTDGSFSVMKDDATFWCADSVKVLKLTHRDNFATIINVSANEGHSIRLIKN